MPRCVCLKSGNHVRVSSGSPWAKYIAANLADPPLARQIDVGIYLLSTNTSVHAACAAS